MNKFESVQEILDSDTGDSSLIFNLANYARKNESLIVRMRKAILDCLPIIAAAGETTKKIKPNLIHHINSILDETTAPKLSARQGGPIHCSNCGSLAIGKLRIDSDWGDAGDWSKVNADSHYSDSDIEKFRRNERPDLECFICCECQNCFD